MPWKLKIRARFSDKITGEGKTRDAFNKYHVMKIKKKMGSTSRACLKAKIIRGNDCYSNRAHAKQKTTEVKIKKNTKSKTVGSQNAKSSSS